MSENPDTITTARAASTGAWRLIAAALCFILCYQAVGFVGGAFASSALPLPNASGAEAQAWYVRNGLSATVSAICQLLSVLCLGLYAAVLRRTGRIDKQARWAYAAVAMMVLSCLLSWAMAAYAGSVSAETLGALRTANFITGGTAHVALLGVFVLLAAKAGGFGKGIRVFAWVAFVPAVASVVSLVVFQGAALILLGRLLCMAWTLVAAIAVARADRR
ncbi:hypothetical protein [Labedaea rhizosphaerae]|uniref:DUF4386 domain-containing protein n=1 Tax=Labedaea rhizosphaerae TaxID=598644 RepID=A0A4R6SJ23_LABRH|nr:hypothetical protein [Labedaea rhizosphaerae]TDQ00919.1 hypothetical protein EV186_102785 [Labedaea rhizosphaerae]